MLTYPGSSASCGKHVELVIIHNPGELLNPINRINSIQLSTAERYERKTHSEICYAESRIICFASEQQILWFEITVHDPLIVQIFHCRGNSLYYTCCISIKNFRILAFWYMQRGKRQALPLVVIPFTANSIEQFSTGT
jgi:hypothetical protein